MFTLPARRSTRLMLALALLLAALLTPIVAPTRRAGAGTFPLPGPTRPTRTGTLLAWGWDCCGQLGDGTADNPPLNPTPKPVPGVANIVAIVAGDSHTLALKADGTLLAWGADAAGQLGDGTVSSPPSDAAPKAVPGAMNVVAIAAGYDHSLALLADGTLLAWGDDAQGQLGDGTVGSPTNNPTPQAVPGVTGVVAIAAGWNHSLALLADGTVLAWGYDAAGQLGDGTINSPANNPTPTAVPGVTGVVAIAAGGNHSLALKADTTLLAWGFDGRGQLGDGKVGSPESNPVPAAVPGVTGVKAIAGGGLFSLALKVDGTLLAWGDDIAGELGDGPAITLAYNPTPKAVPGVANVIAVTGGQYYTLALKADGTLLAWGNDPDGELGDGTVSNPEYDRTPKAVPGVTGAIAIAAGQGHSLALIDPLFPSPGPSVAPSPSPSPSPAPSASPSPAPCSQQFGDVGGTDLACQAIEALAARGVINGCDKEAQPKPLFCPADPTLREQMAALIVRAIPAWVGETGLPSFGDNTTDTELMTRVAALQRHNVVRGYQDDVCQARGIAVGVPCFGPLDKVTYGQTLLFVARAMVRADYWTSQPDDRTVFPDQNGAASADPDTDQQTLDHRMIITYVHYVGNPPDVANVHANFVLANGQGWADASTRAWFARAFWPAIQSH